jgi:hypothetical protein
MSFGYSAGDFLLLVQLAHRTFRNCQKAGDEYIEITHEVRSLRCVLRALRSEAERPGSYIFKQDATITKDLANAAEGCRNVLDGLGSMLAKFEGLEEDGVMGKGKRLWQRLRFGSKMEDLGVVRAKLITFTSTISVLLDTMQIKASDRIEGKIDDGFSNVKGTFEQLRKEIRTIAVRERKLQRSGSTVSLLSLSTYAGDDAEVWREFRRRLVRSGFSSHALERHRDVLQAYMMKLDESGLLDETPIKPRRRQTNALGLQGLATNGFLTGAPIISQRREINTLRLQQRENSSLADTAAIVPQVRETTASGLEKSTPLNYSMDYIYTLLDSKRALAKAGCIGYNIASMENALWEASKERFEEMTFMEEWMLDETLTEKRTTSGRRVTFKEDASAPILEHRKARKGEPLKSILRPPTARFQTRGVLQDDAQPDGSLINNGVVKLAKKAIAPELVSVGLVRYDVRGDFFFMVEPFSDDEQAEWEAINALIPCMYISRTIIYMPLKTNNSVVRALGLFGDALSQSSLFDHQGKRISFFENYRSYEQHIRSPSPRARSPSRSRSQSRSRSRSQSLMRSIGDTGLER